MIRIRYEPNGATVKAKLVAGSKVNVIAESAPDSNEYTWHQVHYGEGENDIGWVRDDVITLDPPTTPEPPAEKDKHVHLYFETDARTIRVFEQDKQLRMNVYHNSTRKMELSGVDAIYLPRAVSAPDGADVAWRSYLTQGHGKVYIARFLPSEQVELIISYATDGEILSKERGFKQDGSAYKQGNT